MARPQQKVVFPFPITGVTELGPYEGQPERSTPYAKNVRGFAWVDNNGTPERGRLGGGQRPGIRNYHPAGNKAKAGTVTGAGIQDINHISSDSIELLSGRDEEVHRTATYVSVKGVEIAATEAPSGNMTNRRVAGCVWDDENNLYVAVINEVASPLVDEQIQLVKYAYTDTTDPLDGTLDTWKAQWTSNVLSATNIGNGVGDDPTGWVWVLQGIAWYGKYVYLRLLYDKSSATPSEDPNPSERVVRIESGFGSLTGGGGTPNATNPDRGPVIDNDFINDRRGASPEGLGYKGWKPATVAIQGNGLAISKGRLAILSTDGGDLTVWQKMVETGETVVVPDGDTSGLEGTGTAVAREICGDSGGNFWVAGSTGDKAALFRVAQDGTTIAQTNSVIGNRPDTVCFDPISNRVHIAGGATLLGLKSDKNAATGTVTITSFANVGSSDSITLVDTTSTSHTFVASEAAGDNWSGASSNNEAAANLAADINASAAPFSAAAPAAVVTITQDVVGSDGNTTITENDLGGDGFSVVSFTGGGGDGSFASYHAFEAKREFNSGNINISGNNLYRLRSNPFAVNDKVVLSTTGTVPTGLTDGTTYRVSSISQSSTTLLHTIGLQYDDNDDGFFYDTPAITDSGVSGEVFTLTRAAGDPARVVTKSVTASAPEAGSHIVFDPKTDTDSFDMVRARTGGGVYLAKASETMAMTKKNIDTAFQTGDPTSAATSPGVKMATNAVYTLDNNLRSGTRQTALVVVAGGTIKRVTEVRFPSVGDSDEGDSGDYALSSSEPVIFSASTKSQIYYVDGVKSKIYKHVVTDSGTRGSVVDWEVAKYDGGEIEARGLINATPGKGKGLFPVDDQGNKPRLIEVWNERVVLAGILGKPQEWYMSRRGVPDDFDYGIQPAGDERACAGFFGETNAGLMSDKINALVPYSDDVLIFGGDHTIHLLSGDPATGAVPDLISDVVGMAWGRAWCKDPRGVLYFFGSRGGVYRMVPGGKPENMTTTTISERLYDINLRTNVIRMVWNDREQGFHLFVSPTDKTLTREHYFYDTKVGAWWIDEYETTESGVYVHNTTCPHIFDGDDPNDRVILLGGRDGRLYKWDISATDDYKGYDAVKIDSKVLLGPMNSASGSKLVMTELLGILAANSSNVDYDVLVGNTAESILADLGVTSSDDRDDNGRRRFTGAFVAGRDKVDRRRAVAGDLFLQLRNNNLGENWALEKTIITLGTAGRRTNRTLEFGGQS